MLDPRKSGSVALSSSTTRFLDAGLLNSRTFHYISSISFVRQPRIVDFSLHFIIFGTLRSLWPNVYSFDMNYASLGQSALKTPLVGMSIDRKRLRKTPTSNLLVFCFLLIVFHIFSAKLVCCSSIADFFLPLKSLMFRIMYMEFENREERFAGELVLFVFRVSLLRKWTKMFKNMIFACICMCYLFIREVS